MAAIGRLVWREQVRPSRVGLLVGFIVINVVLGLNTASASGPRSAVAETVSQLSLSVAVPLVSLLIGSSTIGNWYRDESLVYIWLRSVKRSTLALGVVGASVSLALVANVIPAVGLIVASGEVGSGLLLGGVQAVAWSTLAYTTVAILLGTLARRPLVVGFVYVLLLESALASTSDFLSRLSIRSYGLTILADASGIVLDQADRAQWAANAVPVLLAMTATAVIVARLRRLEVA